MLFVFILSPSSTFYTDPDLGILSISFSRKLSSFCSPFLSFPPIQLFFGILISLLKFLPLSLKFSRTLRLLPCSHTFFSQIAVVFSLPLQPLLFLLLRHHFFCLSLYLALVAFSSPPYFLSLTFSHLFCFDRRLHVVFCRNRRFLFRIFYFSRNVISFRLNLQLPSSVPLSISTLLLSISVESPAIFSPSNFFLPIILPFPRLLSFSLFPSHTFALSLFHLSISENFRIASSGFLHFSLSPVPSNFNLHSVIPTFSFTFFCIHSLPPIFRFAFSLNPPLSLLSSTVLNFAFPRTVWLNF